MIQVQLFMIQTIIKTGKYKAKTQDNQRHEHITAKVRLKP